MNDKIITVAKKAARRMARATGTPYQTCLDNVARSAGRSHWAAFLADPVDVSERPAEPADVPGIIAGHVPPNKALEKDEPDLATDPVRRYVVEIAEEPVDPAARIPLRTRIARMLTRPERGIVKRAERHNVLRRVQRRDEGTYGMPFGRSVENGYSLALVETLPVLALSPPGTGKTASIVVPTIVSCDRHSMVVHDEMGLTEMTSGYRATLGPVTILDLGSDRSMGGLNPLSSSWIPLDVQARTSYVAALTRALSPDCRAVADVMAMAIHDLFKADGGTTFLALDAVLRAAGDPVSIHAAMTISPFLDPATRKCTETTSLRPRDLRGVLDEHGLRPATLYLVRHPAGNERHRLVAAVIQEAIWWWGLTVGPGELSPDGDRHGAFPVTVVLEDVHRLGHMPSFANAIEKGRGRKLAALVTAPSYRTMERVVGRNVDELEALFGVQIVLRQNDGATIAHLERRLYGVTREDLRGSRNRTHLVALQYEAEPVRVHTPFFFLSKDMLDKVYNPRTGKGPRPLTMSR